MKEKEQKILTLLQFARKAGMVVHGSDACIRSINHGKLHFIVLAADLSQNSTNKLLRIKEETQSNVRIISLLTQNEISSALGLPITGIIGLTDKRFAVKILEYWTADN